MPSNPTLPHYYPTPSVTTLPQGYCNRQTPKRPIVLWKSPQLTYKKVPNNDVTNTPMLTTSFSLQHKHSTSVADGIHQTNTEPQSSSWPILHLCHVREDTRTCQCFLPSSLILWFPSVRTHLEVPGWKAICYRPRRAASLSLLVTDNWHRSMIYRTTRVGQEFKSQLWLRWSLVCSMCYKY